MAAAVGCAVVFISCQLSGFSVPSLKCDNTEPNSSAAAQVRMYLRCRAVCPVWSQAAARAGRIAEVGSVRSCLTPGAQLPHRRLLPSARRSSRAMREGTAHPGPAPFGNSRVRVPEGCISRWGAGVGEMIARPLPKRKSTGESFSLESLFFGTAELPAPRTGGARPPGAGPLRPRVSCGWGGRRFSGVPVRLRAGAGGAAPLGRGECGRLARARGGAGPGRGRGSGRAGAARCGGAAPRGRPGPPVRPCPPPPALGRSPAAAAPPAAPPPPRRAMRSCFCLRRGSREPPPAARATVKCPRPRRRPRPAQLRRALGGRGKEGRKEGRAYESSRLCAGPSRAAGERSRPWPSGRRGPGRERPYSRGAPRAEPGPQDAAVLLGAGRGLHRGSARAGLLLRGAGLRARVGRRPPAPASWGVRCEFCSRLVREN